MIDIWITLFQRNLNYVFLKHQIGASIGVIWGEPRIIFVASPAFLSRRGL